MCPNRVSRSKPAFVRFWPLADADRMTRTLFISAFLLCAAPGGYCFYLAHRGEIARTRNRLEIIFLQVAGTVCWVAMGFLFLGVIASFTPPEGFASRP